MAQGTPYAGRMDCPEVHAALRAGRKDDPPVAAHTAVCTACAELVANDELLGTTLIAAETRGQPNEQVLAVVAADQARGARMPTFARVALTSMLVALPALGVLALAPRPDLAAYPTDRMILVLALLAGAAALVGAVVLRPLHRPPAGAGSMRIAFALLVPVWIGTLPQVVTGHPASTPDIDLFAASWACFLTGSLFASVTLLALTLTERRRRMPPAILAASVALAAFAGALALQITCPVTAPAHLVLGHGLIGVVWAAVFVAGAALVGALRPRREPA